MKASILLIATVSALVALTGCEKKPVASVAAASTTTSSDTSSTDSTSDSSAASSSSSDTDENGFDKGSTVVRVCHDGTKVYKYTSTGAFYIPGTPATILDASVTPQTLCE